MAAISRMHRALLLLEHVAAGGPPQTHGELMRALAIPRSTLSDLLVELRDLGFLRVIDRHYVAGPRLILLVHRGLVHGSNVLAGVRPALQEIATACGETTVYVIRVGDAVAALDQAQGSKPIRYVSDLWEPYPLDETASGMIFQAFGPTPPPHLAEVRADGYAVFAPGGDRPTSVATAVHDPRGEIVGAITVVGPYDRVVDPERHIWPALRDGVARLEAGDGGADHRP